MDNIHNIFSNLLHDHVDKNGNVNYSGLLKNKSSLEKYITILKNYDMDELKDKNTSLAFWINAYNAITVYQVLLMVEKKGKVPKSYYRFGFLSAASKIFEDKTYIIGELNVTLSEIENKILRGQFFEPRIHSALNCATESCPILKQEAYSPDKIEEQLEEATKTFINSDNGLRIIKPGHIEISRIIITWYKNDFKNKFGTILDFLKKYAEGSRLEELKKIDSDKDLKPMKYNWKINS